VLNVTVRVSCGRRRLGPKRKELEFDEPERLGGSIHRTIDPLSFFLYSIYLTFFILYIEYFNLYINRIYSILTE
jgi:hypothetical protein